MIAGAALRLSAGLLVVLLATGRCDRSLEWQKRAGQQLDAGQCEEAIEILLAEPHEGALLWHELLVFAALDCFQDSKDAKFVDLALSRLDAALERRPTSASLLHLKGHLLTRTGRRDDGMRLIAESKRRAESNLASGWSPDGLNADRRVLEDIRRAEARVGPRQPQE